MQKLTIWAAGMALATLAACAAKQSEEIETNPSISKAAHNGIYIGPASFLVVGDQIEDEARIRCSFAPTGELTKAVFEFSKDEVSATRQKQAEALCNTEFKGFKKP